MKNLIFVFAVMFTAGGARADEGMWTFNTFPKKLLKERYGFDVSDAWLDHVRLSSVRFTAAGGGGGSGSFVSPRGLVMTNHHVGADCIAKLGATGHDYIKDGFYAQNAGDEIKCPDLELNVVVEISDVTAEVKAAVKPGLDDAATNKAQKEKSAALEKACNDKHPGDRCDVVTLYAGGVYNLYRYKKYTDVRLVFAPEFAIAFFGGDPDNFEFPRFDLDVAFFRVYDGGRELAPKDWLRWSKQGAAENELVFTSGNPGNTERLDTVAQLEMLRDTSYPTLLAELARMRTVLVAHGKKSAEDERQARTHLFSVENSLKAVTGYRNGLLDKKLMDKKASDEALMKKGMATSPERQRLYGAVWSDIEKAEKAYAGFYKRYVFTEGRRGNPFASDLFGIARQLVRAADEKAKPNEKRLREYRDSGLASLELGLFSAAPIHDGVEKVLLGSALDRLQKEFGAKDPLVVALLDGKTAAARAEELVGKTTLHDVAARKALYGDAKAVAASKDPFIVFARAIDSEARAARKRYEDDVESVVKKNLGLLGRAQFEAGLASYPDATFTLRLSFGKVAGYGSTKPFTTFGGLYQKSVSKNDKEPWKLPARWVAAKAKLDAKTPMDFVSTNDIIGGNSGSPVINQAGEVVGLIFDGNIESLPGNFVYDDTVNRSVSVHSSALTEALRKVYNAAKLADELTPASANSGKRTLH